jgi:hypothetical protein
MPTDLRSSSVETGGNLLWRGVALPGISVWLRSHGQSSLLTLVHQDFA